MAAIRRWSGYEARALRHALRISVRAFADHLGVAARTVSKWEQHGAATSPLPDTQAILDTALSRADDEAKLRFELLLCDDKPEEDLDMRRRNLLGLLGPLAVSPLGGRLEELRRGLDEMLLTESSGRDADDWEQTVSVYAHEVGTMPAGQLLPGLVADFTEIQARNNEASGLVRTMLIHCASQLAALTAIALVNLGERHAAQRWWRTAVRAAKETSDPELTSLVRGRHAVFSLGTTPHERVLDLADSAIELGLSKPCVGVVSGLAARAQALAQMGRYDEAARALQAVVDTYSRLPTAATKDSVSQWNWAEQRLRHVESHVHTYAGQINEANQAQTAALAVYPLANFQGRSQIEFHRAASLIRSGDVAGGTRHLTTTLERLDPWQRGDGIVLHSAKSALDMVPLHQRDLSSLEQARELLTTTAEKR